MYIVPSESREGEASIGFRIFVNPMIWWMWVAGPIMLLGTVVALWPAGVPSFVASRLPATAADGREEAAG